MALSSLPYGILGHLLFAFPSGRVDHPVDRFFVGVAYVLTAVYPFVVVLFLDPATSDDCPECPSNPLLVSDDQTVFDVLAGVQSAVGLIATGALIWHFVRRANDADPNERLRDAPVWWVGGATMVLFGALLASAFGSEEGNLDDLVYYGALGLLATVPLAFWFGLLRWRLSEAELVAEQNVRLDAELHARLEELRESRARIVEIGYAERCRMERDLHDGAQRVWSRWRSTCSSRGRRSIATGRRGGAARGRNWQPHRRNPGATRACAGNPSPGTHRSRSRSRSRRAGRALVSPRHGRRGDDRARTGRGRDGCLFHSL